MILVEYDGIWSVTYESLDDGHRLVADYFTDKVEADAFARSFTGGRDPRVVQTVLWHTQDHPANRKWFTFEAGRREEVIVDRQFYRKTALAKLSPQERKALGVS